MVASLPYPPISLLSPASIDSRGKGKKKTHPQSRDEGRRAKLSPAPKNFHHFAEFLSAAGTSPPDRTQIPADGLDRGEHDPPGTVYREGGDPSPIGPPCSSLPLSARGVIAPSLPRLGCEGGAEGATGQGTRLRPARAAGTIELSGER